MARRVMSNIVRGARPSSNSARPAFFWSTEGFQDIRQAGFDQ